jgi:hypothetical protein
MEFRRCLFARSTWITRYLDRTRPVWIVSRLPTSGQGFLETTSYWAYQDADAERRLIRPEPSEVSGTEASGAATRMSRPLGLGIL